jgi:predicted Zn-ribbon and HTH transcriptional regulator
MARDPKPRTETVRAALLRALVDGPQSALELSRRVGVRDKDVAEHIEHIARSLRAQGRELGMEPAECLDCGYVFKKRERKTRPGACPACKGTHLAPPRFFLVSTGSP